MTDWQEQKILIIGKAYPEPSRKYIETVCTGGITEDGRLVRLYPIPFRYWAEDKRYKIFSFIRVRMRKDPSDRRKESHKVDRDSFQILGHVTDWSERMSLIAKAISPSIEHLREQYRSDWTSLGIVPVEYVDFVWKWGASDWSARKKAHMNQFLLFAQRKDLDLIPIKLILKYRCADNPACGGHAGRLIMWEYLEAFRKWATQESAAAALNKLKSGLEKRFSNKAVEHLALVGTHSRYPVWMLGGLFFPPREARSSLFDKF